MPMIVAVDFFWQSKTITPKTPASQPTLWEVPFNTVGSAVIQLAQKRIKQFGETSCYLVRPRY